jgi:hypothetical protein
VRIALIATPDREAGDSAEPAMLAGKSIARHQLDFALALGCRSVICLGHGAASETISLRHAAEAGGARFQAVRGSRELPAAVRGDDQVLVLAQGLLPDSAAAFALLHDTFGILVLPADAGWGAGFERLDLATEWGGAMLIPGRLVAQLDQLPEDAEPVAGLLRIARQAGVPERPLAESELAEGRWQIVRNGEAARALEPAWLRKRLAVASPFRPTAWLARFALRHFGSRLMGRRRAFAVSFAVSFVLIVGPLIAGWSGLPWIGFAALAAAALAIEVSEGLLLLQRSIFIAEAKPSRMIFTLRVMWDLAMVAVGALAIDATRAERLFPPLVTAGLLRILPPWPDSGWRALVADRGAIAILFALASGFGFAEAAFMVLALLLILLRIAPAAEDRG